MLTRELEYSQWKSEPVVLDLLPLRPQLWAEVMELSEGVPHIASSPSASLLDSHHRSGSAHMTLTFRARSQNAPRGWTSVVDGVAWAVPRLMQQARIRRLPAALLVGLGNTCSRKRRENDHWQRRPLQMRVNTDSQQQVARQKQLPGLRVAQHTD